MLNTALTGSQQQWRDYLTDIFYAVHQHIVNLKLIDVIDNSISNKDSEFKALQ